jgi:hypothetical protein
MQELRITGNNQILEEIRQTLYEEIPEINLTEINETKPGELGEPFLIGLVIALGGATLTKAIAEVLKRWMEHRETMKKLSLIQFYLEDNDERKEIPLDDLLKASG